MPQPRPMLRCSRCQHVFAGPWTAKAKPRPARSPAPEAPPEPETPSFSFEEDDDWTDPGLLETETSEEEFALDIEDSPDRPAPPRDSPPPAPKPVVARPAPVAKPPAAAAPMSWDDGESEAAEAPVDRQPLRISLRPVLILLAIVVAGYFVLARTLYANPEWAQQLLERVPVLGAGLNNDMLNSQVDLIQVEGGYQRTKEGKVFFLVKGQALNQASVPITQVQVVARLLDQNGNVLQEKPTFCGSAVPLAVLRDLSLDAMEVIPHLKPSERSVIDPGRSSPFVVVFTDVSAPVAEFTTEIVAAQRQA